MIKRVSYDPMLSGEN